MYKRTFKGALKRSFALSAGWLFADLLLALAMLFLAANTIGIKLPSAPLLATPTATPTSLPRLELDFHEFSITVDPAGLLNNSSSADNAVKLQVEGQPVLKGRSVGLVIAYGGAPDDSQISTAQQIAGKVYKIVGALGEFTRASHYDTLYLLGGSSTTVVLDIYLFAR